MKNNGLLEKVCTGLIGLILFCGAIRAQEMNLAQTLSDQAQRTTLAFSGLAMMTGNLYSQSFYPPGKVADYTGFQYLRDNDPDHMGHNTSFLTRVAENVIYILNNSQLNQLADLAVTQQDQFNLYGYKRYPLMKAFRRLMDGEIPSGATGLSLSAVKQASRDLYLIDGQISFDRALLYANVLNSLDSTQKAYLAAMKGKGWNSWPDTSTTGYQSVLKTKMQSLPQGSAVLVMTYASDLFSWYAGSVDADVYFCPERQGTYYGGFYMKDAPAIGHEGYSISEQLTATAGAALSDSSKGYVTTEQATVISSLVETQRNNLYASATSNIVKVRTDIATLLRGLLTSTASSDSVKAQVLELSGTYGELDGENNYNYATVFAQVYKTLGDAQKTKIAGLRASIMSGTYSDGTPFDFTTCTTPYLYSSEIKETSLLDPYIASTDYLFNVSNGAFTLTSGAGTNGGTLPIDYTADGSGASPALSWSNAPAGTKEFAMLMTTLPGDGTTKWNWVLFNIPASTSGFGKNSSVGTTGMNSDTGSTVYAPPQSKGPGDKLYTFTLYALSASPTLPASANQVTGEVLTSAISSITLGSVSLNLSYARQAPVAAFTYKLGTSNDVAFTNASGLSATSWAWNFGDGGTSIIQNPTHTYSAKGAYTVTLKVTNDFGNNTTTQTVNAGGIATELSAAFAYSPSSPVAGQTVTFTDSSTGSPTAWAWSFGDGGTSAVQNPTHSFATTGNYTVELTASNADGGNSIASKIVTVGTSAKYALTVVSGTGSASYAAGASVPIQANPPATGKTFQKWTATAGTFTNANVSSTTFTMPAAATTVTANYADTPAGTTHVLTVVSGTGSGSYATGASVSITANAAAGGKVFDKWTASAGTLASAISASTNFTMPALNATVTANYKDVPDTSAPQITSFTVPSLIKALSVPVSTFTASDNVAVTGYMITLTSTAPLATASGWTIVKPTTFSAPSAGIKTLYAWAKDSAGNVSAPATATVNIDMTAPVVSAFTVKSPANSLTIPITSFTVTEATGIAGYLITETYVAPAATLAIWKSEVPTSCTVSIAGSKTLYAWAKDSAGNVSSAKYAICVVDMTKPVVTTFTVPAISKSKTVAGIAIRAADNVAVASYQLTESATAPDAGSANWKTTAPTTYAFDNSVTDGSKTLYAWAKDSAANVSLAKSATLFLDATAPVITSFTVPSIAKTLSVPISIFTAEDNVAVTGYMITLTSTAPLPAATTWKTSKPTTFSVPSAGIKTLYAWVRDSAGNVSPSATATVNIDMTAPAVSAFTVKSPVNSLTIPITSFTVTEATGIAGYLITEAYVAPAATLATWKSEVPASYTVAIPGSKILYAWAKDTAGNVSYAKYTTCVVDMTKPLVTTFTVPTISKSKTVAGIAIRATDNVSVASYQITESASAPDAGSANWKTPAPTTYAFDNSAANGSKTLYAWAKDTAGNVSLAKSATLTLDATASQATATVNISVTTSAAGVFSIPSLLRTADTTNVSAFNMEQTISDGAQRTTLAFAGLALITGNLEAQTFFPPGKVADYTGFQYLRDNDPDKMGHNTSFLTRIANNVIYILNDTQFAQLKTLAIVQTDQINLYGYKRYPLMEALRRQIEDDIPNGSPGLNLNAVKKASRELYLIDGQISFDRTLLYANILSSLDATQKAYLEAMKGKGWNSWPDITNDQINAKMITLPKDTAVAVMTYASDLFSWYAGSIEADVYFCPERHGTYYGSFYIKDAPAIGHEGYSISEQLTATVGSALCDSSKGYVTASQASLMSSLIDTQRDNLYAGSSNIVDVRTQIATLLRSLMTSTASSDSVKTQVLALSSTYGDLDGENNYNYAIVFAQFYNTLTDYQKTQLAALRKSIMSGTYSDGTAFDFSVCETPFLYSAVITDLSLLDPYIGNTDYLFFEP